MNSATCQCSEDSILDCEYHTSSTLTLPLLAADSDLDISTNETTKQTSYLLKIENLAYDNETRKLGLVTQVCSTCALPVSEVSTTFSNNRRRRDHEAGPSPISSRSVFQQLCSKYTTKKYIYQCHPTMYSARSTK